MRLLADVEARAAEHDRPTLQCAGYVPPGETGPAEQFAQARGYAIASREGFKDTGNAEVNEHMNAVNEALGYRSIETLLELQKKL